MPGSAILMSVVGLIYTGTVVTLIFEGHPYKALMFFGYVVAQVGLVLDVIHSRSL